jgi:hypothetical protein
MNKISGHDHPPHKKTFRKNFFSRNPLLITATSLQPGMNTMKSINKRWHSANPMPTNPTMEERIEWHTKHAENCGCREIPKEVRAEMGRRKTRRDPTGSKASGVL